MALAIVPILIGMTGVFAFSTYTGTVTTVVNGTDASLSVSEAANVLLINATSTIVSVTGPSGIAINQANFNLYAVKPLESLGTVGPTTNSASLTYKLSIQNLYPGDYVAVIFAVNNTGSGALNLAPLMFTPSGANGYPILLSKFSPTTGVVATSTPSTNNYWGYSQSEYAIYPGNAYALNAVSNYVPSGVLPAGGTAVYWIYFGLASSATSMAGQSAMLTLTIGLTSAN